MNLFLIFKHVTNSVSSREEFNKDIEKNLKVKTKADHYVQSEGERIIADRLFAF